MARKKAVEETPEPLEEDTESQEDGLVLETLEGGGFNPDRVRFLVYGESGAGKTRFAAAWPDCLVLDIDDGLASVDWPVSRIRVENWESIGDIYMWLAQGEHEFRTIVIDSLNEAQVLALREIIVAYPNIRRAYDSLAGQSDYGKMLADFDTMIRSFKALPVNLVLIAQATSKDFDTDMIGPQLIGKQTARNICRMMDVVGYIYRENNLPHMGFGISDYISKDRSGKLPSTIEDVNYSKLAQYWET